MSRTDALYCQNIDWFPSNFSYSDSAYVPFSRFRLCLNISTDSIWHFSLPECLLYQTVSADKPLKLVYTLRIIRLPILLICYIDYTYVRYIRSFCFFLWLFLKLRIRSQHMNWTELNWTRVLNTMLSKVVNGVNTTRWTLRCSVKCNTAETFRHTETQTPSRKHGRLLYQETKVIFIVPEDNAYN